MMKLSIALPLPSEIQEDLGLLRGSLPAVDWMPQNQTFLCVRPLGQVSDGRLLEELDFAMARLRWSPFALSLKETHLLERPQRDRLVCGVAPQEPLEQLRKRVDAQLRESGFPQPRQRFRPHVAIGRLESSRRAEAALWLQRHNLFRSRDMTVDRLYVLEHFESDGASSFAPLAAYGSNGEFYDMIDNDPFENDLEESQDVRPGQTPAP